jgi:glycosyltransferase involved in cell wall biosynthesis
MAMVFIGNSKSPLAVTRFEMISTTINTPCFFFDRYTLNLYDENMAVVLNCKYSMIGSYHLTAFLMLRAVIKLIKPEVIHFHGVSVILLALSIITFKGKIISTPQGSDINQNYRGIYKLFTWLLLSKLEIVTAKSNFMKQRVSKITKTKCIILNWGVDPIFESNYIELKQSPKVEILSPRSFKPIYNIEIILESIRSLKKSGYDIRFILVTLHDNDLLESYSDVIDKVYLNASKDVMHGLLTSSDMMISIPTYDGFSTSIVEALFSGAKPIISDIDSYKSDLLEENLVTRTLISVESLVKTLKVEIANIKELRDSKLNRIHYAHKYYSNASQIKILKELYSKHTYVERS